MEHTDKIYIAGHKGMVGSAVLRKLQAEGYRNFVFRSSNELDLRSQAQVEAFLTQKDPIMSSLRRQKSAEYWQIIRSAPIFYTII